MNIPDFANMTAMECLDFCDTLQPQFDALFHLRDLALAAANKKIEDKNKLLNTAKTLCTNASSNN